MDENKPLTAAMGTLRKLTRSQERYRRYQRVSECFDSFLQFCQYEAAQKRA